MNLWTTRKLELSAASPSEGVPLNIPGHTFQVIAASTAAAEIRVSIDERDDSARATFTRGMGWEHVPFRVLWVSWDAQPGVTITLGFSGSVDAFDPKLTRLLVASSSNSVTVDNPLGSPVPVNVTGQPLDVTATPSGGYTQTAPHERDGVSADWFLVNIVGQSMTQGQVVTLANGTTPTGRTSVGNTVPAGKVLIVEDAWVDTGGSYGGYLYSVDGSNAVITCAMGPSGHKALGLIGRRVPAGQHFKFRSEFPGAQDVSAAVMGRLDDE